MIAKGLAAVLLYPVQEELWKNSGRTLGVYTQRCRMATQPRDLGFGRFLLVSKLFASH